MSDGDSAVAPRLPVPMGVIAETGDTHPPLTGDDLREVSPDEPFVLAKARRKRALGAGEARRDPMNLSKTGWGALFARDADPAIKEALQPLLDWRRGQVNDEQLFKVFEGARAVRPGQAAQSWATTVGVSLSAPVIPLKGVPYYLLIVGSPSQISFEFQAQLDLQWAVGRLTFDTPAEYAAYAQKVVEYEKGLAAPRRRRATVWIPRNPLDLATPLLAGSVIPEFLGQLSPTDQPLGKESGFEISTFVGDGEATKARLTDVFRGTADGGPPALLFTGSHGAEWSIEDPGIQRERQGALVTQEWTRGTPLEADHYFSGADLPSDANVHGLIMFLFACFGGGCPANDSYYYAQDGSHLPLAPEPIVARLPQALLARGALAVIAHVDRAFSYAFEDVMGTPQAQLLRTPLDLLASGERVGHATDPLNQQWSTLAAQLGLALGGNRPGEPPPRSPLIANLFIARDDARNYMVLGDPAVQLRVEAME
jgi:hypothetical protein